MKKSLIMLSGVAILALASGQHPVHADLSEDTMKCLIQSVVHADGSFSEKEKNFLRSKMGLPKKRLNDLQYDCMTPKEQLLKNVKKEHKKGEDSLMLSMVSAFIANADGVVNSAERSFIEDLLEVFGKKRNAQPLLDLCVVEMSEDIQEKVNAIYSFRSPENIYEAMRAEIPQNLKAIKYAELSYESEYDVYVKCAAYPATPTKTRQHQQVMPGCFPQWF